MFFLTLLPVFLSLGLILLTRRTMLSLLAGAGVGALILCLREGQNIFFYFGEIFWKAVSNDWHYSAIFFTLLLGGFAALMQEGGGLGRLFHGITSPRGLEIRVMGLGFLCFFDGLANSLLLGRIGRPLADKVGVSRERLAYLADTTSSAVACLAPISTWIAMQLGLINTVLSDHGIEGSPYEIFLKSLPLNFYCLLSLLLAFFLVFSQKNFGSMKKSTPHPVEGDFTEGKGGVITSLFCIGVLLTSIPFFYYLLATETYFPITFRKVIDALGSSKGPVVLMISVSLSFLLLFFLTTSLSIEKRVKVAAGGMKQLLIPLGVLLCAWLFSAVMKDLELGKLLAERLKPGDHLRSFPALIFLLGCALSFTTGTSWGTMALLFPIAFGMLEGSSGEEILSLLPILSAAIFSGAVFGDHCSPYSDTTIVSAIAAGCSAYDHVRTQLPYALLCGTVAALLFLVFSGVK